MECECGVCVLELAYIPPHARRRVLDSRAGHATVNL